VGALPGNEFDSAPANNLWVLTAFGARGLTWGALCAELLTCQMNQEPLPLERALCDAQSPIRYRSSPR
jgi:tRNA 5-methylaminomethyl-2-thiouridine biosynthesis bifunctional protein